MISSAILGHVRLILLPAVLGLLGWAILSWDPFWRWDLAVYDRLLWFGSRPAPQDIVIVAVDEASLSRHGRWPWPRALHADVLDRLRSDGAKAIGLDILFAEPDRIRATHDLSLARSIEAAGNVVLPVLIEQTRLRGQPLETPPIARLANAAAGLGHVGAEIDPDGVVRSIYLFEGVGSARWPHLSLALLERLDPERAAQLSRGAAGARGSSPYVIVRRLHVLIPFLGPPGHFSRVSASQVIAGEFAPGTFSGKTVLVGVTAAGLGDVLPTPVSGYTQPMPGVELIANVLSALRTTGAILPADRSVRTLSAILLPAAVGLLVVLLPPGWGFGVVSGAMILIIATSSALLAIGRIWLPFLSTAVPILLAYPLVSLMRLEAAMRHLDRSLVRLREQLSAMPEWIAKPVEKHRIDDPVAARLHDVEEASLRLDRLRRFIREALEQMANGVLVTDSNGHVVIGNALAEEFLCSDTPRSQIGVGLVEILDRFARVDPPSVRDAVAGGLPTEILRAEITAVDGRRLLLLIAPLRLSGEKPEGLIVNLTDISALRAAERQRRETLAFLSHDIRSPLFSMLAAAHNARARAHGESVELPAGEVDRYARRALELAESFLWLARAESVEEVRREEVNLVNVCEDGIGNCLPSAQSRSIELVRDFQTDYAPVLGDAELLERAVINLLDNAIRHSPEGGLVRLGIARRDNAFECTVVDSGPGIPQDGLDKLFRRFTRLAPDASQRHGAGLGLAIVKAVVEKHNGAVSVESTVGRGSRFTLRLPALPDADDAR